MIIHGQPFEIAPILPLGIEDKRANLRRHKRYSTIKQSKIRGKTRTFTCGAAASELLRSRLARLISPNHIKDER